MKNQKALQAHTQYNNVFWKAVIINFAKYQHFPKPNVRSTKNLERLKEPLMRQHNQNFYFLHPRNMPLFTKHNTGSVAFFVDHYNR